LLTAHVSSDRHGAQIAHFGYLNVQSLSVLHDRSTGLKIELIKLLTGVGFRKEIARKAIKNMIKTKINLNFIILFSFVYIKFI
jgi:hypothetical protein